MKAVGTDTIVAMISACIAVIATVIGVFQNRKNWYISSVSLQRLEWAENLRNALYEFICAYYDKKDLHPYYSKVALYLNSNNSKHKHLFKKIEYITFVSKFLDLSDSDINGLVVEAQKLLRYNWRTVKNRINNLFYGRTLERQKNQKKS